jgi:hypothetical protein
MTLYESLWRRAIRRRGRVSNILTDSEVPRSEKRGRLLEAARYRDDTSMVSVDDLTAMHA